MQSSALSPEEFAAAVSAVTNAFGDPTRRDIFLLARAAGPDGGLTANEVAEHFGLHPNVARHHLEKLAAGGYLRVELARHEAAGRPSKRYCATATDTQLNFPPRQNDLLATLLARALERLPMDEARALAEQTGYDYGRALAQQMEPGEGHRSAKAALASVADALTAHGFAAHAEARGESLALVAEHCPFGEAAKKYPHVLCAVDTGMIKGMLEGLYGESDPTIEESRPGGGQHCVTRL